MSAMPDQLNMDEVNRLVQQAAAAIDAIPSGTDAVLFFGATGAGKSTTGNLLLGNSLTAELDRTAWRWVAREQDDPLRIGAGSGSETSVLSMHQVMHNGVIVYFLDTPGNDDTGGVNRALPNGINLKKLVSRLGKVVIALTVRHFDFTERANGFLEMIDSVNALFSNNINANAVVWVVTKPSNPQITSEGIMAEIRKFKDWAKDRQNAQPDERRSAINTLNQGVAPNRIVVIPAPESADDKLGPLSLPREQLLSAFVNTMKEYAEKIDMPGVVVNDKIRLAAHSMLASAGSTVEQTLNALTRRLVDAQLASVTDSAMLRTRMDAVTAMSDPTSLDGALSCVLNVLQLLQVSVVNNEANPTLEQVRAAQSEVRPSSGDGAMTAASAVLNLASAGEVIQFGVESSLAGFDARRNPLVQRVCEWRQRCVVALAHRHQESVQAEKLLAAQTAAAQANREQAQQSGSHALARDIVQYVLAPVANAGGEAIKAVATKGHSN